MHVGPFTGAAHEWDEFVRSSPGWTHFHLHGWKTVIERVLDHECIYLSASDDSGRVAGVLPLVRVKSLVFGHYLVSMPFLNYGGPLGDTEAVQALAAYAAELARHDGARLLELRSRTPLPIPLHASHRKITVLLDLPSDTETLWNRFDRKLRGRIRRPQKEGITLRFGREQVVPFFEVFAQHMRELGTPTQPRRLFETIADVFTDDAWIACAYLGERPIACGYGFRWNDEFEMTWSSALVEFKNLAPNMLLYWTYMERAINEGLATFNFGRCTPGSGTHQFKQQWGTRDEQLWWYGAAAAADTTTPSPHDSSYAWGPRLWKRLPTPVATALGPRIARYLP